MTTSIKHIGKADVIGIDWDVLFVTASRRIGGCTEWDESILFVNRAADVSLRLYLSPNDGDYDPSEDTFSLPSYVNAQPNVFWNHLLRPRIGRVDTSLRDASCHVPEREWSQALLVAKMNGRSAETAGAR